MFSLTYGASPAVLLLLLLLLYALRLLRSQGLHGRYLWDVTGAVLVSRLTYASQAWWGLINEGEKSQLGAIIAKAVKQGFLAPNQPTLQEICDSADVSLFRSILQNTNHVLHQLLPPVKIQNYSFCANGLTIGKSHSLKVLH